MPSSFIYGALLATAHADETSLIQAKLSKPSSAAGGGHGVESLLESAKGFLKNGATHDVVEFVDVTLEEVSGVTIPAIEHASATQQAMVYDMHDQFQVIKNKLNEENRAVNALEIEEEAASNSHKECRAIQYAPNAAEPLLPEEQRCINKQQCEGTLYGLWTAWESAEEELIEAHNLLVGHFCPPEANGTLHTFRVASGPKMTDYMNKKRAVDEAERQYDAYVPNCVTAHNALDTRSSQCNSYQSALEDKSCDYAHTIRRVLTDFHTEYDHTIRQYEDYLDVVRQEEEDRHREFVTLQVVKCLLDRVHELDGVPCDTANGVTDEVGHCEERHSMNVCEESPVLCINKPPAPPKPPHCRDRDSVIFDASLYPLDPQVESCTWLPGGNTFEQGGTCTPITYVGGECLPVLQPHPCTPPYEAQEYSFLPPVPEAPFTHENPGCNAYPQCGQLTHCDFEAVHPLPGPVLQD